MTKPDELPQTQPGRPSDMVLRLQIGVGGVLVVLLLVGLANIIGERGVDQAATQAAASAGTGTAPPAEADQPLVELGVQPASPDSVAPPTTAPVAASAATAPVVTDLPADTAAPAPPKKQP